MAPTGVSLRLVTALAAVSLLACGSPKTVVQPDAGGTPDLPRLWWTTFPRWVSAVQDGGEPTTCAYLWGMEDFYSVPSDGPDWARSRAPLDALLVPAGVLVDPNHAAESASFVAAWKTLHDTEGKRVGYELPFFPNFTTKQWAFDPSSEAAPGVPWYQPIDLLVDAGMGDMVLFIDGFDPASALGIDLRTLPGDSYAGPITDEVKAIKQHAPDAFVAVHLGIPYVEDGTLPLAGLDLGWIPAFVSEATAKGTTIDAVSFDCLRSNPDPDGGTTTTLDASGLGQALDAARDAGFMTGVFVMSYQDFAPPPPACGFPESGTEFEQSALAGIAALQDAGLASKVDFYDLSSWTHWPRQALPEDQAGTFTHAVCAVEGALSLGCSGP